MNRLTLGLNTVTGLLMLMGLDVTTWEDHEGGGAWGQRQQVMGPMKLLMGVDVTTWGGRGRMNR